MRRFEEVRNHLSFWTVLHSLIFKDLGAVFLISLLFRGLGLEIFELIPEDLRNLFHILKRLQESDADEITKTHATIALSELNSIVKAFLSPSAENRQRSFLEKQLYIINNDL